MGAFLVFQYLFLKARKQKKRCSKNQRILTSDLTATQIEKEKKVF